MPIIFDSSLSREYFWERNPDRQQPKSCNTEAESDRTWTWRNTDTTGRRYTWSRWNSGRAWALKTSVILIKINFCDATKLSSFTFFIALLTSSTHGVEQVVFTKVRAPLRFKRLHQRMKRLWAHICYVEVFSGFVFYLPIGFVHQVGLRQVQKVLPNVLCKGIEKCRIRMNKDTRL